MSGSNGSTRAQRTSGVGGRGDLEALALEELLERRGDDLLVVDDQDPARAAGRRVVERCHRRRVHRRSGS